MDGYGLSIPVLAGFSRGRRVRYTAGVKQFGRRAGRDGESSNLLRREKISTDEGELSQSSPFFFVIVHLHGVVKAAYLG
jgi:hypothetical protein